MSPCLRNDAIAASITVATLLFLCPVEGLTCLRILTKWSLRGCCDERQGLFGIFCTRIRRRKNKRAVFPSLGAWLRLGEGGGVLPVWLSSSYWSCEVVSEASVSMGCGVSPPDRCKCSLMTLAIFFFSKYWQGISVLATKTPYIEIQPSTSSHRPSSSTSFHTPKQASPWSKMPCDPRRWH